MSIITYNFIKYMLETTIKQTNQKQVMRYLQIKSMGNNPADISKSVKVVSTLWMNVEIMLIRRWKWNKIRRRIFNVAQRWYNVSVRRWNNVETTLHNVGTALIQHCFNLASTLVKAILNPIGLVMILDLEIHEYFLFC